MSSAFAKRALWLGLPFVLVAIGGQVLLPRLADTLARGVGEVAALAPSDAGDEDSSTRRELETLGNPDEMGPPSNAPSEKYAPSVVRRGRRDGSAPHVIFIPAQAVARAVKAKGIHAVASHGAVPGVVLSGISALGVGLEDGDLVTVIGGEPTPDVDAAVAALTRALGQGAKTVQGTLIRHGETYAVRVEIPDRATP